MSRSIDAALDNINATMWNNANLAQDIKLKQHIPTPSTELNPHITKDINRQLAVAIRRLIMNITMTGDNLKRMKFRHTDTCDGCNNHDSADHQFHHCPANNTERTTAKRRLKSLTHNSKQAPYDFTISTFVQKNKVHKDHLEHVASILQSCIRESNMLDYFVRDPDNT